MTDSETLKGVTNAADMLPRCAVCDKMMEATWGIPVSPPNPMLQYSSTFGSSHDDHTTGVVCGTECLKIVELRKIRRAICEIPSPTLQVAQGNSYELEAIAEAIEGQSRDSATSVLALGLMLAVAVAAAGVIWGG